MPGVHPAKEGDVFRHVVGPRLEPYPKARRYRPKSASIKGKSATAARVSAQGGLQPLHQRRLAILAQRSQPHLDHGKAATVDSTSGWTIAWTCAPASAIWPMTLSTRNGLSG